MHERNGPERSVRMHMYRLEAEEEEEEEGEVREAEETRSWRKRWYEDLLEADNVSISSTPSATEELPILFVARALKEI